MEAGQRDAPIGMTLYRGIAQTRLRGFTDVSKSSDHLAGHPLINAKRSTVTSMLLLRGRA